ncbi:hypothetical protein GCM10010330_77340 [Streptomyces tendae]|nr:hypothetical protein GCM10010330_77340 [Streptomyces tendae]
MDAVGHSKMHPIPVIRKEERDSGPWPLISEHMDGEPRWVHPDVTATRVPHIRANGRLRHQVRPRPVKSPSPEGIAVSRRSPTLRGRAVPFADCACSGEGGWLTGERTA